MDKPKIGSMRLLEIFDVSVGVYDINNKTYVYVSEKAREFFGIPKNISDDDIQKFWLENIVHPDDRKEQKKYVANMTIDGDRSHRRTYRIIHPEKGVRTIMVFSPDIIRNDEGEYIVSLSVDITS